MGASDNIIKQLRLKITFFLVLRYGLFFLTFMGLLLGIAILVIRVLFLVPCQRFLWAGLSFLPGVIWATIRALRETPSQVALRAFLDEKNRCGGLLMASEELNLGSWQKQLPSLSAPALKWHCSRSFGLFLIAVLFVAISFIIPQRYVDIRVARPLNINEDVEKIKQQIHIMEEETIISKEAVQEYEQRLEQLRKTASGYDPVKTWEALDHLQQSVKKEAEQFTALSLGQIESLAQTQTLAQGLFEDAAGLDSNLLSEAMLELSTMIQSCTTRDELFKNKLGDDCLKACKKGALSAEQLEELLEALKENKAGISNCLAKLCKAELVDLDTLKLCEKLGTCNSQGLIAFLNENSDKMGICDSVSLYCQNAGRGGITRGRADAPMTWTEGSAEEDTTFKEQVLPPASLAALKESAILGVSVGAPSVEKNLPPSEPDILDSTTAGSGKAFRHTILPRHKDTVKRYFERK